jgi:hypothetical protein
MEDQEEQESETDLVSLIDTSVFAIISFFDEIKSDSSYSQEMFTLILSSFESLVFSSKSCSFCQFIIFYLVNQNPDFYRSFSELIWNKLEADTSVDDVIRAASYLTSLMTRSEDHLSSEEDIMSFIQFCGNSLNSSLDDLSGDKTTSISKQSLFFTLFQAMVHIIVYKSSELSIDSLRILKLMNIQRMVSSSLNPLSVCPDHLAFEFSKVCTDLQLAMCSAIIQRNSSSRSSSDKIHNSEGFNLKDNCIWLPFHGNASPLILSKIRAFLNRSSRRRLESLSQDFLDCHDEKMSGISFSASPGLDNHIITTTKQHHSLDFS